MTRTDFITNLRGHNTKFNILLEILKFHPNFFYVPAKKNIIKIVFYLKKYYFQNISKLNHIAYDKIQVSFFQVI